jgi:hypothetical protein
VKRTLLDGAIAIRFRCRTCDGFIVVRNPEKRKIAAVPSPPPPPEPEMPAIASTPVSQDPVGPKAIRMEDLTPHTPVAEVRAERDSISDTGPVKRVATAARSTTFNRRTRSMGMFSIFVCVGIFLLASGAYYFRGSNPWGKLPGMSSFFPGSPGAATGPLKPAFDVRNLESYIPQKAVAGNLFVITGTVKNVGKGPSRGIRVRATLFGMDGKALIKQESIAGNPIDKFTLPHMMRTAIEAHLASSRDEAGNGNNNIPPGKSVPFIVVCFEPPGGVESFEVRATDAGL